ncbi:MAG: hypothetical protein A2912_01155 [Candidatus Buchananbacteria bacterium RIFCSPLOWO2_01_FULL_40_23b]|uniref:Uncharacterized protein n=1 Tax=Candidatus Buchananbacteria bacterium RIFCSPLOWO2_01_FULL_40_23b TaxID=1797544 RepID=A0A1G1YTX6_9BACT|nr:MAG: hypothetical protein A2912_01155 [Candidatus Buchananbacteria bacterium RIFCSPLOWO2_01_FULL_40_23b]
MIRLNDKIATIMDEGYIDDHIEVRKEYDPKTFPQVSYSGLYEIVHRADFCAASIPHVFYEGSDSILEDGSRYFDAAARSRRVWNKVSILDRNLSKEEALLRAKNEAEKKNLPLYLKNEDNSGTISFIQKPEGWEHHWG